MAARVERELGIPVLRHSEKKPAGSAADLEAFFGCAHMCSRLPTFLSQMLAAITCGASTRTAVCAVRVDCSDAYVEDAVQVPSRPACDGRRSLPDRHRVRQQERHAHRALLSAVNGRRADDRRAGTDGRGTVHRQMAEQRHCSSTAQFVAVRGDTGQFQASSGR